jgi:hypothetical protein
MQMWNIIQGISLKFSHSIAEMLILFFVALNCYVNVIRYSWDKKKKKAYIESIGSDYDK